MHWGSKQLNGLIFQRISQSFRILLSSSFPRTHTLDIILDVLSYPYIPLPIAQFVNLECLDFRNFKMVLVGSVVLPHGTMSFDGQAAESSVESCRERYKGLPKDLQVGYN